MSKPIFYEGQAVGCLIFGEGVVRKITSDMDFPLEVRFIENQDKTYTLDGRYYEEVRPTLYPIEQYREIIANLPAPEPEPWKPKPGEWCWFWNADTKESAFIAQFKGMYDGYYMWGKYQAPRFKYCAPFTGELPEHLKEVQP